MSYEPEVVIEDTESILLGTLKHYALTRIEQIVDEVKHPFISIAKIRELSVKAEESIERLDTLFFKHLGNSTFPKQLTETLEESILKRDGLLAELKNEAFKSYPKKDRLREIVSELLSELEVFFTLFDTFISLRGRYEEETEIIEEGEEEERGEDEIEIEIDTHDLECLREDEDDDLVEMSLKANLRKVLSDDLKLRYLFELYNAVKKTYEEVGDLEEALIPSTSFKHLFDNNDQRYSVEAELINLQLVKTETRNQRRMVTILNNYVMEKLEEVLRELGWES